MFDELNLAQKFMMQTYSANHLSPVNELPMIVNELLMWE
jgi:hypothetical protein